MGQCTYDVHTDRVGGGVQNMKKYVIGIVTSGGQKIKKKVDVICISSQRNHGKALSTVLREELFRGHLSRLE